MTNRVAKKQNYPNSKVESKAKKWAFIHGINMTDNRLQKTTQAAKLKERPERKERERERKKSKKNERKRKKKTQRGKLGAWRS
jgi:hypothetical protein